MQELKTQSSLEKDDHYVKNAQVVNQIKNKEKELQAKKKKQLVYDNPYKKANF